MSILRKLAGLEDVNKNDKPKIEKVKKSISMSDVRESMKFQDIKEPTQIKIKKYLKFIGIILIFVFIEALFRGVTNMPGGAEKLAELKPTVIIIAGLIIAAVIVISIVKKKKS